MPITDQAGQRMLGLPSATANSEPVTLGQITDGSLALTVSSLSLTTPLPVASGGTGAATASAARTNLSAAKSGANTDITSLALTTPLSVAQGGTGSTTASGARTNLAAAASGANSDITSMSGFTGLLDLSNTTAGQIKFPATQNASADAHTLDDYEEGTFTPVISGLTTAGVGTYSVQSGSYQKIGKFVHFKCYVDWSAHTGTGNIKLSGFPFSFSTYGVITVWIDRIPFTSTAIQMLAISGTSYAYLQQLANTTPSTAGVPLGSTGVILAYGIAEAAA